MPSPFLGQEDRPASDFVFDWRQTNDPIIRDKVMDLRYVGSINYKYDGP